MQRLITQANIVNASGREVGAQLFGGVFVGPLFVELAKGF